MNVLKGKEIAEVNNGMEPCITKTTQYEVVEGDTRYCIWDTRGLNEAWWHTAISTPPRIIPDSDGEVKRLLRGSDPRIDLVLFCIDAKKIGVEGHWKIYDKVYSDFCERKLKVALVVTRMAESSIRRHAWKRTCQVMAEEVGTSLDKELMEAVPKFEDLNDPRVEECKSRILRLISNSYRKSKVA